MSVVDRDPYDTGRDWNCEQFAETWSVGVPDLRRALNLANFRLEIQARQQPGATCRRELEQIAKSASEMAKSLRDAQGDTIFRVFWEVTPTALRGDLRVNAADHRRRIAQEIQDIADRAQRAADAIVVTRAPITGAASYEERAIATPLALLWWRIHNCWPNVSNRKAGRRDSLWTANEGGRFVMAGAKEFFGLSMSDQRLRTTLATMRAPGT